MTPATLIRTEPGAYVEGEWVPGDDLTGIPIEMIIPQPLGVTGISGGQQLLPEGEKLREYLKTYVYADLQITPRNLTDTEGDQIDYNGVRYKVMQVDTWDGQGNYRKVVLHNPEGV